MAKFIVNIFAAILYCGVLVVNYLANAMPINGLTTGEVSDKYFNLFAPAGITFSIWGVIYLLLGLYVLYQFNVFKNVNNELVNKINIYFIVTSIANILWIISWHYLFIGVSVILMLIILVNLILIINTLYVYKKKKKLSSQEYFLLNLPFSVYFGWITVATIANITAFLVSINWNGFGVVDQIWMVIILLVGAIIGTLTVLKYKDVAYMLVFIWAYAGILLRHISADGFNSQYVLVIMTIIVSITLFVLIVGFLLRRKFLIDKERFNLDN